MLGGREIDLWWEGIFLCGERMSTFLAGGESPAPPPPHTPIGKTLTSTLVWDVFDLFVILEIKFRVANIKWNLLISAEYYLLNWALASVCGCSQKSWILFTVSTCRAVRTLYEQQWLCCLLPQVFLLVCMAGMVLFDAI